jgi:hypothetical protein
MSSARHGPAIGERISRPEENLPKARNTSLGPRPGRAPARRRGPLMRQARRTGFAANDEGSAAVKRRFESSLARRLLPLGIARACAPNTQSRPGARAARRARRAYQTPEHVHKGLRQRCSCSSPPKLGSHRPGAREVAARPGVQHCAICVRRARSRRSLSSLPPNAAWPPRWVSRGLSWSA